MRDLDLAQLRALRAAVDEGTLEAAARVLHLTPSAVSQRLKALEVAVGRVLLLRTSPVRPTESGHVVLRLAREVELLTASALGRLDLPERPTLPLAVNADSLASWVLEALAPLADKVTVDVRLDDQDHTSALLRDGTVMAAVTASSDPVQGCSVTALGVMRYLAVASPSFIERWFPAGLGLLEAAPVLVYDRKDHLQDRWLTGRGAGSGPRHHLPSTAGFLRAAELGLGWAMLPDLQAGPGLRSGALVELEPGSVVDVPLWWQQWRLPVPLLDDVAAAVLAAARQHLH